MSKYIECKHSALVRCKYLDENGKKAVLDFYPFVINKYTGTPEHTGFTQITQEQYKLLNEHSKVFISFIKQKLLIVRDELPVSAQTPQALIASKDQQIRELQSKLAAAEAALEGHGIPTQAEIEKMKAETEKAVEAKIAEAVAAKEAELSSALARIAELEAKQGEPEKAGGENKPAKF